MLQEISFSIAYRTLFYCPVYRPLVFLIESTDRRKGTGDTCTFLHHKECIKENIAAADSLEIVWGCDSAHGLSVLRRAILKKLELYICSTQTWNEDGPQ